jgi:hypothetical protein
MDVWYLHVWYLQLSSEQMWNGDAGGTEASDPTRRPGLDIEGSTDVTSWLALDANVTWSQARGASDEMRGATDGARKSCGLI